MALPRTLTTFDRDEMEKLTQTVISIFLAGFVFYAVKARHEHSKRLTWVGELKAT